MGKISNTEMEKYENNQGDQLGFFNLKDDGETAYVRFMHQGMEDITRVVCHTIEVDGKYRKVNCIRNYDEPLDVCPLCANSKTSSVRIFLELRVYEKDEKGKLTGKFTNQIWERGRDFNKKLQSLCNRLRGKDLCDMVYEIERVGKKGDQRTTYEIYECPEITVEEAPFGELPEQPYDPVGGVVLDKTKQELEYYLQNGKFPSKDDNLERRGTSQSQPINEPVTSSQTYAQEEPVRPRRRI